MDADAWYKEHMAQHEREVEARVLREVEAQRAEERRQVEAERALAQRQAEVNQLVHQFEHRVGRRLKSTNGTHSKLGPQSVVRPISRIWLLDLSGPELAAWLEKNGVARSD